MSKIVVYTAIAGDYDTLKEPPVEIRNGVDFVAFLDSPPGSTFWQTRKVWSEFGDPCRNARIHKILPHVFFPEAEYSLWIDGAIQINFTFPVQQLILEYLKDHDLAVFRHPERQCLYREAEACIHLGKDDPMIIQRQMAIYRKENYPSGHGLAETCVLLRRHTAQVRRFNEAWYEEIKNNSRRDQLSFDYVAHKTNLKFRYFPKSLRPHPGSLFRVHLHKKDAAAKIEYERLYELRREKLYANRVLLVSAMLAVPLTLIGTVFFFVHTKRQPLSPVGWWVWLFALIPWVGFSVGCLWRSSAKRKIRQLMA